jgi:hypothetical protein
VRRFNRNVGDGRTRQRHASCYGEQGCKFVGDRDDERGQRRTRRMKGLFVHTEVVEVSNSKWRYCQRQLMFRLLDGSLATLTSALASVDVTACKPPASSANREPLVDATSSLLRVCGGVSRFLPVATESGSGFSSRHLLAVRSHHLRLLYQSINPPIR